MQSADRDAISRALLERDGAPSGGEMQSEDRDAISRDGAPSGGGRCAGRVAPAARTDHAAVLWCVDSTTERMVVFGGARTFHGLPTSLPLTFHRLPPPSTDLPPPSTDLPPPSTDLPPPSADLPPPSADLPPPSAGLPPPSIRSSLEARPSPERVTSSGCSTARAATPRAGCGTRWMRATRRAHARAVDRGHPNAPRTRPPSPAAARRRPFSSSAAKTARSVRAPPPSSPTPGCSRHLALPIACGAASTGEACTPCRRDRF